MLTAVNMFKNIMRNGDLVIISDGNHKFRAIAEIAGIINAK
jgi:5-methylcytosine-specific restriction protein B